MVGRLSTYAKNRILNLRFQNNYKIKHIAQTLLQEDNIKVSRESISTFLKKYIDTKSINDKPRSGRNKKLTSEEIQLIGEVTRLNRDITAPKIKQHLNLNVSTHTILRASKLFEWNKHNPNSNEAKKAAALERQLNGETKRRSKVYRSKKNNIQSSAANKTVNINNTSDTSLQNQTQSSDSNLEQSTSNEIRINDSHNLNLISEKEILTFKNISSSPMVFATKVLMKLFSPSELHGHNVSGKTFSKNVKNKKALDEKRIGYIRWLVENNFETSNRDHLWKMCRTAINKIILINEKKSFKLNQSINSETELQQQQHASTSSNIDNNQDQIESCDDKPINSINLLTSDHQQNNLSIVSLSESACSFISSTSPVKTTIVKLNDIVDHKMIFNESQAKCNSSESSNAKTSSHHDTTTTTTKSSKRKEIIDESALDDNSSNRTRMKTRSKNKLKRYDNEEKELDFEIEGKSSIDKDTSNNNINYDLNLLAEKEILLIKNLYCSPMIFSTKVLTKIFTTEELCGHNLSGKTFHKKSLVKPALDEKRLNYIKWLVEKNFENKNKAQLWKSCRKAMCRVLRNIDKKAAASLNNSSNQNDDTKSADDDSSNLSNIDYRESANNIENKLNINFNNPEQPQQSSNRTVVVLIDDPEQERQMLLEQQQQQ